MENEETQSVLLADDQARVRSALRLLLDHETGVTVVGEAADSADLLRQLERSSADVLLLDWELPGLAPEQLLKLLGHEWPALRVIAMSSRPEARRLALAAGASAFLSKGAPPETVLAALQRPGSAGSSCRILP